MRKLISIFTISILFYCATTCLAASDSITGEVVATGEVTTNNMAMTISLSGLPSLNILSPKNETYITTNLLLNYSVNDGDEIWYNLDGIYNITISSSVNLSANNGIHTLYLYSNNSYGVSSKSIIFNVNTSKLIIYYDKYKGIKKGSSTNFELLTYEDLQSVENVILEHSDYGKISFSKSINITDDLDSTDNIVDLDSNTNISFNHIYINSSALPNFDKTATLSLYNLSFSNPRILIDGEVCPSAMCTVVNYSNGLLQFNVKHFASYSAEETPEGDVVIPPVEVPSSGGGGGSTIVAREVFIVDIDQIGVEVKQGSVVTKKLTITNKENRKLNVEIQVEDWGELAKLSESSFSLGPLESKTIFIDFIARENYSPDIYIGKIIASAENFEKEILFSIVIESKTELFDVSVNIPKSYMEIFAGEEFLSEVELFNLGETGRIDARIEYFIKNSDGEVIIFEEEVKAIETSLNFVKTFNIPSNIPSGKYLIYVRVSYGNQIIGASSWFSILDSSERETPLSIIDNQLLRDILVTLVIIIIFTIIVIKKMKRTKK